MVYTFESNESAASIIELLKAEADRDAQKIEADEQPTDQPVYDFSKVSEPVLTSVFRQLLEVENLSNPSVLLNVFNLVKMFNTFDPSFFENREIWFPSLDVYLNIKTELMPEIKAFATRLSHWFLSSIYSCHKVEYTMLERAVAMPLTYHYFILLSDFATISAIIYKAANVETKDLVLVDKAYLYVSELAKRSVISSALMESFVNTYAKKAEENGSGDQARV